MGRLFWKFFLFIWLAQLVAIAGVSATFWFFHQQEKARWEADGGPPPRGFREPPPGLGPPPPHRHPPSGIGRPPPRRHDRLPVVPLVAGLLTSLAGAAFLAWYFAKPIRSLKGAFDGVAKGRLQVRVGKAMGRRRDELADLGRDFDAMADRLEALVDGQRRLLHDVSHELRSPLARLQAAIGLLRQQPGRLEDALSRIERESVRMDSLVGELLTLSRLEAGVRPAMDEDIPVEELLADIAKDAGFEAETSGRRLSCHIDGDPVLRGNGELLLRAVENVVRNAVRHTAPGTEVRVEAQPRPDGRILGLAVLDAGPGVPEGDLEKIFQPFFRSGEGRDNNGYGLGLALARRVVEAHGGTIAAANRPEGGLRVEMVLPLAAARA